MFDFGEISAYPTDTSFGFGVRADDDAGLKKLANLKGGREKKFFSLMCANDAMLREFAKIPDDFDVEKFFFERPRTAIFRSTEKLPKSKFWPKNVAFRVATIREVADAIEFPITATSANLSGKPPIFRASQIREIFGEKVLIFPNFPVLPEREPSEIWDFSGGGKIKIR